MRPKAWIGSGPSAVVTDLGVYRFTDDTGEMELASLHPGVTLDQARANASWPLRAAADLGETGPPTAEELRLIRKELDPDGAYTR